MNTGKPEDAGSQWDHSSDANFYDYYSRESLSESTLDRFNSVRERVYRLIERQGRKPSELDVLDIGCGAGTQCRTWVAEGHRVNGIDVNAPLIGLARERAQEGGRAIRFEVGSATSLPYADESMDVCLMPELLEHVADWESCLREAVRVLRPGGVLFLSTSNVLCPKQDEFELPLYSWYPGFLKRRLRAAGGDHPAGAGQPRPLPDGQLVQLLRPEGIARTFRHALPRPAGHGGLLGHAPPSGDSPPA